MAYESNVTVAYFPEGTRRTVTHEIYRYAYGQVLVFEGLSLPDSYQVDFSNYRDKSSPTQQIGGSDGVSIPDTMLTSGKNVFAFLILHAGENDGASEYAVEIPVRARPEPAADTPTPEQQSAIDQAIIALNAGTARAEAYAKDAEAWADGERDGEPVESDDPAFENNAKYYAEQADGSATLAQSWAVGGTGTREDEELNNAKYYAMLASFGAEDSGYAWFDVNDEDGHMYIYISDDLSEDVSFRIVEETGHLEVTYT